MLLLAVVLLAPLPFGGHHPSAVLALELIAAAAWIWTLWQRRAAERLIDAPKWLVWPVLMWLGLGLAQLVAVPIGWHTMLAPAEASARAQMGEVLPEAARTYAPLSASPSDTFDALLVIATCLLLGLTACHAIRQPRHLRQAALAMVISALFQATYGAAELIAGRQHIFGFAKQYYLGSATGTFINRNHFATFLALALPFALVLARGRDRGGRTPGGWRARLATLHARLTPMQAFAGLSALSLIVGVFLSSSRGGLIAALAGALVLTGSLGGGRRRVALVLLFALPAMVVLLLPSTAPGERFLGLADEIRPDAGRPAVWAAGLGIAAAHPLLGTGFGTFDTVFPSAAPPTVKLRYRHAHSDWLQVLVEAGLPGLIAALALAWGLWRDRSRYRNARGGSLRLAALAALVALAVHALIDFPLRLPAIAATAAILIGALASREVSETFARGSRS